MIKVGINGMGIMGRAFLRASERALKEGDISRDSFQIVAFNDIYHASQIAPVLKHDTSYGVFGNRIDVQEGDLIVGGQRLHGSMEREPRKIEWRKSGVDIVYESTGIFLKPRNGFRDSGASDHIHKAGAKKVVFSAPSVLAQKTIVMGVNDGAYSRNMELVSAGSCTTNCLAPLAKAVHDAYGIIEGFMTTIHAYTIGPSQDSPNKDPARAFSPGENIIPTSTGAASAIGEVMPELKGKLNGSAFRVPVRAGSALELKVRVGKKESVEEVNQKMKEASWGYLQKCFSYGLPENPDGPIVSSMVIGNRIPSIFDPSQTMWVNDSEGEMLKVGAWYDNVMGYSHQAVRLIDMIGKGMR